MAPAYEPLYSWDATSHNKQMALGRGWDVGSGRSGRSGRVGRSGDPVSTSQTEHISRFRLRASARPIVARMSGDGFRRSQRWGESMPIRFIRLTKSVTT